MKTLLQESGLTARQWVWCAITAVASIPVLYTVYCIAWIAVH
jgi:hypothetical protein